MVGAWLRAGELDLAIIQVLADDVKENDVILRHDRLGWFASPDLTLEPDGSVPLITFGPRGFYRPIVEGLLRDVGFGSLVVVECESTAGVIAAVEAGLRCGRPQRQPSGGCRRRSPRRRNLDCPTDFPK